MKTFTEADVKIAAQRICTFGNYPAPHSCCIGCGPLECERLARLMLTGVADRIYAAGAKSVKHQAEIPGASRIR